MLRRIMSFRFFHASHKVPLTPSHWINGWTLQLKACCCNTKLLPLSIQKVSVLRLVVEEPNLALYTVYFFNSVHYRSRILVAQYLINYSVLSTSLQLIMSPDLHKSIGSCRSTIAGTVIVDNVCYINVFNCAVLNMTFDRFITIKFVSP